MSDLVIYVLCSSSTSREEWENRSSWYPGLTLRPVGPVDSATDQVHSWISSERTPFLVCREEIWFGQGLGGEVRVLINELNGSFRNWALCSNRGVRWDGRHVYDFTYNANEPGLQTSSGPQSVICLDDNLMLVNAPLMRSHKHLAPGVRGSGSGVALSLECLLNGSTLAVSPRLMAVRTAPVDAIQMSPEADTTFQRYYRAFFLNHMFPTPDGVVNVSEIVDYSYVAQPARGVDQADILDLYDESLARSWVSGKPSLTICCRTQFRRPELLSRGVLSFSVFRETARNLMDVSIRLITDQQQDVGVPCVGELQALYPAAGLECWYHEIRPPRHSRTDLLLSAIEKAESDYIWFVDDDDFVNASAAIALARTLRPGRPAVVIGGSTVLKETWEPQEGGSSRGRLELVVSERSSAYRAAHVFRVLKGQNFTPVCSLILPVPLMQERTRNRCALGDFNEDYFLLLLALTAPRVEVVVLETEVASISIRGEENTVAQKDRARWHLSLATFLQEVLNNPEGNSPFLWQLGNTPHW